MSYPQYQPPQPTTVTTRRGANHGLHLFLTICTCGVWAITGWPIAAAMGRKTTTVTGPPPGMVPPPGMQPLPPPQWQQPQQLPPPGYQPGYGQYPGQHRP